VKTINITLGFFGHVVTLQTKVTEEEWKHQARLKNRFEVNPTVYAMVEGVDRVAELEAQLKKMTTERDEARERLSSSISDVV